MGRLSLHLPPLAGDYSGVCSALFGLDCLVIIVDASCCTRNYVEYDEPRWARRRKTAFSAQLRTLEAVMGDDERIVSQTCDAVDELRPSCVAVVGSPVPAIMGMDLAGIAREVEARTGVPSLGMPATGFETYEAGVSMALEALVRRFAVPVGGADGVRADAAGPFWVAAEPGDVAAEGAGAAGAAVAGTVATAGQGGAADAAEGEGAPVCDGAVAAAVARVPAAPADDVAAPAPAGGLLRLNVLGLSPQDFASEEDMRCQRSWLEAAGAQVAFCPDGAFTLADVAAAATADASVVVSWSGLAAACLLRERCGVPYVVGRPLCASDAAALVAELREGGTRPLWELLAGEPGDGLSAGGGLATGGGSAVGSSRAAGTGPAAGNDHTASAGPAVANSHAAGAGPAVAGDHEAGAGSAVAGSRAAVAVPAVAGDHEAGAGSAGGRSAAASGIDAASGPTRVVPGAPAGADAPLLLVGEQVCANTLRAYARGLLEAQGLASPVVVASLFSTEASLAEPQDFHAADEAVLADYALAHPGLAWVGDPLYARIPELAAAPHLALPHEAVSSTLYEADRAQLAGTGLLGALASFLASA